ncbi:MAG: hypothetical protein RLZZ488_708 [Pseudomonadota bacterium]|jgi:hypothetical protein
MSQNRKLLFVAVGSALLGITATLVFQDSNQEGGQAKALSRKTDSLTPPKPLWEKPPAAMPVDTTPQNTREAAVRPVKTPSPSLENPPQTIQIRENVARDPHSTPQALLAFAETLSVSLQGAFADKETRYTVSRQLIACARDSQTRGSAQAARALCLYNLERLAERFPDELSPSYQSLLAELPDDLIFVSGVEKNSGEK